MVSLSIHALFQSKKRLPKWRQYFFINGESLVDKKNQNFVQFGLYDFVQISQHVVQILEWRDFRLLMSASAINIITDRKRSFCFPV